MWIWWVIAAVLGSLITTMFIFLIIDNYSNNKWFCDFFGWHKSPDVIKTKDFFLFKGKCPRCGKEVLRDGNGDWF